MMKIAIASQNKREITGHAGRCRKWWIYEIEDNEIKKPNLLELEKEQAFHDSNPHEVHPLDEMNVIITGGMGKGLVNRLAAKGIEGIITPEIEPDLAIKAYLNGTLERTSPSEHDHHTHGLHHHH